MTPENFCYWLQGFFEIGKVNTLNEEQVKIVKDHLQLVFSKVTPSYTTYTPGPPGGTTWIDSIKTYCSSEGPEVKLCSSNPTTQSILDKIGISACCSAEPAPEKGGFWNEKTKEFELFSDTTPGIVGITGSIC